jgi:hypothetical protein
MAADMGLLHGVARTTSDGWQVIGGRTVEWFDEGQASVNPVAAVPSLHSAFTMLVALLLWPRVRRPLLLGWMCAGGVMGAWAWWERRRERVTVRGRSRPPHYRPPAANSEVREPGS